MSFSPSATALPLPTRARLSFIESSFSRQFFIIHSAITGSATTENCIRVKVRKGIEWNINNYILINFKIAIGEQLTTLLFLTTFRKCCGIVYLIEVVIFELRNLILYDSESLCTTVMCL